MRSFWSCGIMFLLTFVLHTFAIASNFLSKEQLSLYGDGDEQALSRQSRLDYTVATEAARTTATTKTAKVIREEIHHIAYSICSNKKKRRTFFNKVYDKIHDNRNDEFLDQMVAEPLLKFMFGKREQKKKRKFVKAWILKLLETDNEFFDQMVAEPLLKFMFGKREQKKMRKFVKAWILKLLETDNKFLDQQVTDKFLKKKVAKPLVKFLCEEKGENSVKESARMESVKAWILELLDSDRDGVIADEEKNKVLDWDI